jgi:site-specific recombinase XerD
MTAIAGSTEIAPPLAAVPLTVEAERAVSVLMRKSPSTQRTYRGIYARFAGWLAEREGVAEASVASFSSEAFVAYLDELEQRAAPSTVKKERAALRKLARYLHQLRLIDATVILMVEIATVTDTAPARQGLDSATWERVLTVARARLTGSARQRCSPHTAARDLALIQVLGGAGLRSHEARGLPADPFDQGRSDNQGGAVYLRVHGKGRKLRSVPLYADVVDGLARWRELREQTPELAGEPHLFAQLGRRRRDGSFPDAGGMLSTAALIRIVRPVMLAAGVPAGQAHPHTLRHTFGRLYMAAPGAELSRLQRIMGHASPDTTSRYVHHADHELAAEHKRIERLRSDPLARQQQRRHDRALAREQ